MPQANFVNTTVGPYRLVDFLGAGGMGEVYRGIHTSLGRMVAVKVLVNPHSASSLLERFQNEARIQAGLAHPNVVALYDFLTLGSHPCIVMEYVDGDTVDERIRRYGALPVDEALQLFERMVDAVGYLHRQGIVHRDLKCNNIKLTASGTVKLLDFGLAQAASTPKLTMTGHVVGTLDYLSPEQLAHERADAQSDLWALGVILYELVTGRLPFEGQNVGEVVRRIVMAEYFAASTVNPRVPRLVDQVIGRCLKPNPKDRYESAEALLRAIAELRQKLHPDARIAPPDPYRALQAIAGRLPKHRWLALGAGVTAAAVAIVAAVMLLSPAPRPAPVPLPVPPPHSADVPVSPAGASLEKSCGMASASHAPDSVRTITVDVIGGIADVWCDTERLGQTPFAFKAVLGSQVRLLLKQSGHEDQRVDFTATESTRTYTFAMRPAVTSEQPGRPVEPWLVAAWLPLSLGSLFGRRERKAAARETREEGPPPGAKPTNTGMAAVNGVSPGVVVQVKSDVGCVRETNEDTIGYYQPDDPDQIGVLVVVADGMGGHSAGEVASRLAVETVIQYYTEHSATPETALPNAIKQANRVIQQAAAHNAHLHGMGTTCTALAIRHGWAYCAHVGDSRLYLMRDGQLLQMTEDHSAVMDLVKRGVIDRDLARHHPDRNVIVRALGSRAEVEVAEWPRPLFLRPDDRFLLSSDGLHDLVSDDELAQVLSSQEPSQACETLIEMARSRGGHDNISVGIVVMRSAVEPLTIPSSAQIPGGGAG
jgi:serine/threonine protein phosphatase PrpC